MVNFSRINLFAMLAHKLTMFRLTTCSRVEYPDSAKKEPADVSMFPRKKLCQDADLEVDNIITTDV